LSLFSSSRQESKKDKPTTEEDPSPEEAATAQDDPGQPASTDKADKADKDTAAAEDTATAEETAADEEAAPAEPAPEEPAARRGRLARFWAEFEAKHPAVARARPWVVTGLAALFVLLALVLPNELDRLEFGSFIRMPVEAIYLAALLLVLPRKAKRGVAIAAGVILGVLTVLKFVDMGFYSVLDRPFDLVLDWVLLDNGQEFLRDTLGQAGAVAGVIGLVILVILLLVLMTLAVVRLSNIVIRNSKKATRTTLILGTVWLTCATLGLQFTDVPFASKNTATLVQNRAEQIRAGVADEQEFAKLAAVDKFDDTPKDKLLTGLRGKNVIFAFIESYGRNAVEDPEMAPSVDAMLKQQTDRLSEAGFSSQSGWLKSPTTGAGSWLAHSTLMSGLWIDNEQRYRTATASDRLTLTGAFRRSNAWRTVGLVPGVRRSWPEGQFYHFDKTYDSHDLGYKGPMFSWSTMPDQYSLKAFEELEHGKKQSKPLMTTAILTTSHNPWSPLPTTVGWDEIGDGSLYHAQKKAGKDPKDVWKDAHQVRNEYRRSIEYSVRSLTDYVAKYGDKDTVLVFLGDHQPVPTVVGNHASRDVPIAMVAHDKKVMDRISDWRWEDGLKPGKNAPVWRMNKFRDRFMTTYGPQPGAASKGSDN
jgi:hypothetical protein